MMRTPSLVSFCAYALLYITFYLASGADASRSLLRKNTLSSADSFFLQSANDVDDDNSNSNSSSSDNSNGDDGTTTESIKISSLGDWGTQDVVTSGVAKWVTENAPDGVLLLGDNFYPAGVKDAHDPQFSLFENGLQGQDPNKHNRNYYVIAGNHDYYGNVNAILDYAKINPHWILPSLYYTKTITSKTSKVKVFFVFIDTWGLNGGDAKQTKYANAVPVDKKQYQWIQEQLSSKAAKSADWVVVVGHFPLYSCAKYDHSGLKTLEAGLKPLLKKYKVDAFFYGHDHILQYIEADKMHHFGSGAGARTFDDIDYHYPGLKAVIPKHFGYMEHEFTAKTFKTTIYYSNNGVKTSGGEFLIQK